MGPLTNQSKFSFDKLIHLPRNSNQNSDNRQYIEPFFHSIALLIVITVTLGHKHISFSCTLSLLHYIYCSLSNSGLPLYSTRYTIFDTE